MREVLMATPVMKVVKAVPVQVLGCIVGNLWDIYINDRYACRCTYEGNRLHRFNVNSEIHIAAASIEEAINAIEAA
jgi:hypothetical protein